MCSTSTILGTNGLNSADVPFSNKQTKLIDSYVRFGADFPPLDFAFADPLTPPGVRTSWILSNEHAMLALCTPKYQWIRPKTMQKPVLVATKKQTFAT